MAETLGGARLLGYDGEEFPEDGVPEDDVRIADPRVGGAGAVWRPGSPQRGRGGGGVPVAREAEVARDLDVQGRIAVRAEARLPAVAPREEPRAGPRRRGLARGVRLGPAGEEELGDEDEEDEVDLADQGRAAFEVELGADPDAGPIDRLLARQTAVLATALSRRPHGRDDFGVRLGEAGEDGQPVA